jgi:hypothetical protein
MLHLLRVFRLAGMAVDPRIRQVGKGGIGHLATVVIKVLGEA